MSGRLSTMGVAKLRKALWKETALYVKLIASEDGIWTRCYTCDRPLEIGTAGCQAGHFLPKGANRVHYFEPDNIRPQCTPCNLGQQGNQIEFERRLRIELGDARVDQLKETAGGSFKPPRFWYVDRIVELRERIAALRSGDYEAGGGYSLG